MEGLLQFFGPVADNMVLPVVVVAILPNEVHVSHELLCALVAVVG